MKNKTTQILLIFCACLFVAVGCGIKGPPLPPLETIQTSETNAKSADSAAVNTLAEPQKKPVAPTSSDATIKK